MIEWEDTHTHTHKRALRDQFYTIVSTVINHLHLRQTDERDELVIVKLPSHGISAITAELIEIVAKTNSCSLLLWRRDETGRDE